MTRLQSFRRWPGQILLILMTCLAVAPGLVPAVTAVRAQESSPVSEVVETPEAPTVVAIEPTPEPTTPSIGEATEQPAPTVQPTEAPAATEAPTAEPTIPTHVTDTLTPVDVPDSVTLGPGQEVTFTFTYAVSTGRRATVVDAEVRDTTGALAAGWMARIGAAAGWSVSSATVRDTTATGPRSTISLVITVQAPAAIDESTTVTLHLSSHVETIDGTAVPALADQGTLASLHVEPDSADEVDAGMMGPMSIENGSNTYGAIACTTADGRQRAEPGEVITFNCVYTVKSAGIPLLGPLMRTVVTITSTSGLSMSVAAPGSSPAQGGPTTTAFTFTNTTARSLNSTFAFDVAVTVSTSGTLAISSRATFDGVLSDPEYASASATLSVAAGNVSVDNNNAEVMNCATLDSLRVGPGGRIDIVCTAYTGLLNLGGLLGATTFTVTSPGAGWQVMISNQGLLGNTGLLEFTDGPNPGSATYALGLQDILGLANLQFRVSLIAPSETAESEIRAASVTMGSGSNTVATTIFDGITFLTPISKGSSGLVTGLLLGLDCVAPGGQAVAPGGSVSFGCTLSGLAGLQLTLAQLQPELHIATGGQGWTWSLAHGDRIFSGAGAVTLDLALLGVDLLANNSFTITLSPACTYTANTLVGATIEADLNLSALGLLDLGLVSVWSNMPTAVRGSAVLGAPAVTATNIDFGTSQWTGSEYSVLEQSLTLEVGTIPAGCTNPTWWIQVSGENMTSDDGTIPIGSVSYTGGSSDDPGLAPESGPIPLDTTFVTIATGTDDVQAGSQVSIDLSLSPPDTAPTGDYTGTLTFTTAVGE